MKKFNLLLPDEQQKQLTTIAGLKETSVANLIRNAIESYLQRESVQAVIAKLEARKRGRK